MKQRIFKFIRYVFVCSAVFILLLILVLLSSKDTESSSFNYQSGDCYEAQNDGVYIRHTTRSWKDYFSSVYCMKYNSDLNEYVDAKKDREDYTVYNNGEFYEFWGNLYQELYEQNKDKLNHLIDSLWTIQKEKELNRFDFANMLVCFVQDIPYVYILPDGFECEDQDGATTDCLENVKYGILSPIEFLHTLKGDCDTRTVLLYTLFKQFNYHPKIAVSNFYEHSVLLLDVPATGDYITIETERYYFWETTASNWQAGILPPSTDDISKWEIALF